MWIRIHISGNETFDPNGHFSSLLSLRCSSFVARVMRYHVTIAAVVSLRAFLAYCSAKWFSCYIYIRVVSGILPRGIYYIICFVAVVNKEVI